MPEPILTLPVFFQEFSCCTDPLFYKINHPLTTLLFPLISHKALHYKYTYFLFRKYQ